MINSKCFLFGFIFFCVISFSCNSSKTSKVEDTRPYFEGEIKLSEARGLYGALTKVNTTYYISENRIKREQRWGGVYSVLDNYAGIIIDMEKDSVTMYYADKFSKVKNKHTLSIKKYKTYLETKTIPNGIPSPVDHTFELLPEYKLIHHVKDSTVIHGFTSDFSRYHDNSDFLKQDIFDSKEIKVKREFLELIFINLPKEINFPLVSESKLTFSEISNDSIIKGKQTRALDQFARKLLRKKDSTINKESDLEKLASNKWLNLGLKILKKGVDLNIHVTTEVSEFSARELLDIDISLPLGDFTNVLEFDDFLEDLPTGGGGDFDD
ncbi:hypothetical protein [uncultured Aquimarina sp.]|uniref:hypothetical protein n=1 Tax=uncultured Aquimarina sp. TaxID=575652 RepID=UPI002610BB68|nr:hypothetical protein [uncultured Aquimarina sp.]